VARHIERLLLAVLGASLPWMAAGCGNFAAQGKNAEGVRLFEQARFQDALRQFEEARYEDPNNADSYYNVGATLHRLGKVENRPDDVRRAEQLYRMCLDRNPSHRDAYRGLAVLLAEQGQTREAYFLLQSWVDRQPTLPEARVELARLYDELGDRTNAKAQLLEALRINPDHPRALTALGKIREDMGERAQALAAYQRSYSQDSRQPELAARIASLQSSLYPVVPGSAPGAAAPRWGAQPAAPLR